MVFAGPYFTYAAGRPLEDDQPVDRWPDAPESIRQTRWSIQNKVNGYAKLEDFSVDHLTVLAWQTPGTRKVSLLLHYACHAPMAADGARLVVVRRRQGAGSLDRVYVRGRSGC